MGSKSETTLEISDFRGINRFADGTVTPPNEFYTLDGLHPVSRGELSTTGAPGVFAVSMAGVARWVRSEIIRTSEGYDKLLAWFVPNVSSFALPTLTTANFTGTSAGAATVTFIISYVGPGGVIFTHRFLYTSRTALAAASTFTFVLPAGLPDYIAQVDVYHADPNSAVFCKRLCGSAHRGPAGLPVSVACWVPGNGVLTTAITGNPAARPDTVWVDPGTTAPMWAADGLIKGKIYYLAIAGDVVVGRDLGSSNLQDYRGVRASVINSAATARTLSFVMPDSISAIIRVSYAFRPPAAGANTLTVNTVDVKRFLAFIGQTPEDVLQTGDLSVAAQNQVSSIIVTSVSYTMTVASSADETATFSNAATEVMRDGDKAFLFSSSAADLPGGLTNNTAYWIRVVGDSSGTLEVKFAATEADLAAGTFINISSNGANYSAHHLYIQRCIFEVAQVPRNSRNSLEFIDDVKFRFSAIEVNEQANAAIASRTDAFFRNHLLSGDGQGLSSSNPRGAYRYGQSIELNADWSSLTAGAGITWSTSALPFLGCYVFDSLSSDADAWVQLLPDVAQRSFSALGSSCLRLSTSVPSVNVFWLPIEVSTIEEDVHSVYFGQRLYLANGENTIWYTNGNLLLPIRQDNGKAIPPTSKYISAVTDSIIACGGHESFQNSQNQAYYCTPDQPFNWGTNINSFNVAGPGQINGVAGYSQNLLNVSYSSFAIVSKSDGIWVWDATSGPRQLFYSFGFASPRSFIQNSYVPMFVGRDNIYVIPAAAGAPLQDIGDEIAPILREMVQSQYQLIEVVYQNRIAKILYQASAGDSSKTAELWLEMRTENGALAKFYSGPHTNSGVRCQASGEAFDGLTEPRILMNTGGGLYQADLAGVSRARSIVISRLGMDNDHFWKLLKRIYLAVKLGGSNETFSLTLDGEDGSSQYTGSATALSATASRQLLQYFLTTRWHGRVNKLTIANTSVRAWSLFDISMLYEVQKRRQLR